MKLSLMTLSPIALTALVTFSAPTLAADPAEETYPTGATTMTETQQEQMNADLPDAKEDMFLRLDTNDDGRISEAEATPNGEIADAFSDIDADADGQLSAEELDDWDSQPVQ